MSQNTAKDILRLIAENDFLKTQIIENTACKLVNSERPLRIATMMTSTGEWEVAVFDLDPMKLVPICRSPAILAHKTGDIQSINVALHALHQKTAADVAKMVAAEAANMAGA